MITVSISDLFTIVSKYVSCTLETVKVNGIVYIDIPTYNTTIRIDNAKIKVSFNGGHKITEYPTFELFESHYVTTLIKNKLASKLNTLRLNYSTLIDLMGVTEFLTDTLPNNIVLDGAVNLSEEQNNSISKLLVSSGYGVRGKHIYNSAKIDREADGIYINVQFNILSFYIVL